jgi:hypothetical protein
MTVSVENSQGTVDTSYDGPMTVSLVKNPGGATLGGTLTVTVSKGVAVFSGLTLNKVGTGYELEATSGGVSSKAVTINVTAASAPSTAVASRMPTRFVTTRSSRPANARPAPISANAASRTKPFQLRFQGAALSAEGRLNTRILDVYRTGGVGSNGVQTSSVGGQPFGLAAIVDALLESNDLIGVRAVHRSRHQGGVSNL